MKEKTVEPSKEARSIVKYLRISPRKVRLVINAIRRQPVGRAFHTLLALKKKAARIVEKSLKSAVANAKVKGLAENQLVVSEVKADGGPTIKRFMSRSMGRADQILKRTTHLTLTVRETEKTFGPPAAPAEGKGKQKEVKAKREKKTKKAAAAKA